MDIKLTNEQYTEIMTNAVANPDGSTNKKCPICNNDVIFIQEGRANIIKCKTQGRVSIVTRGI